MPGYSVFGNILVAFAEAVYHFTRHIYYVTFVKKQLRHLLHKNSRYYNKISDKKLFERRVWDFIRYNKFVPRDLKVTLSLKSIIASHATQLALYLPEEAYDYYERIILYKDYYLSRVTNQYHKAEVNPGLKVIVFSVRAIYESVNRADDGINVMLHEFAHALWLEHKLMASEYRIFMERPFVETDLLMESELERSRQNEEHFFRKYAFANKAEFFAVSVENFFERPESFKDKLPELYQCLTRLFQQDPLRVR